MSKGDVIETLELGQTAKVPLFYVMNSVVNYVIIENCDVPEEYYKKLHQKLDVDLNFVWNLGGQAKNILNKYVIIKRISRETHPEYFV
jgi:hypothetical protein